MENVTFKGSPLELKGTFIKHGQIAPSFKLTNNQLQDLELAVFSESKILLSIFPSIDTEVCSETVRDFNVKASELPGVKVLCISKDLPFAQARFCGAEGIENVMTLSAFRDLDFGSNYGVEIASGALRGLFARAVIVLDEARRVIYAELITEITSKPNYSLCLQALSKR